MIKTRIAVIALFLLAILIPVSTLASVRAYHVDVAWGQPVSVQNQYERDAMADTTSYIVNIVNWGWAGSSWVAANYYGSNTNNYNVYTSNNNIKNSGSYDYVASFHCGDMYPDMLQYGHWEQGWYWDDELQEWEPYYYYVVDGYTRHYAYYGSNWASNGIEDYVLQYDTSLKNKFTFIWTCANGDLLDTNGDGVGDNYYYYDPHGTGLVGMPAAWTQSLNMYLDGYSPYASGDRVYMGFENTSRGLCDNEEFITHNYGDFVKQFYFYALVYKVSINTALDWAMQDMGVSNFGASALYNGYQIPQNGINWECKMHVYGNGWISLP
jgi:hypothetical protein